MNKQLKLKEWEGRKVVFTAVYGSWNYLTADSTSDIDYKIFVMPTLEDLYTNHQYSYSGKIDGNDWEIHDIRKLPSLLSKANPSYLEIIASDYIWANEGFEDYVKFLTDNKYKIGTANMKGLYHAAKGIMHEKMGAIKKGYPSQETNEGWKRKQLYGCDTKQVLHFMRIANMIEKIFTPNIEDSKNIMSCFKLNEEEVKHLLSIKNYTNPFLPKIQEDGSHIEIILQTMEQMIKKLIPFDSKYDVVDEETNELVYNKTKEMVLENIIRKEEDGI